MRARTFSLADAPARRFHSRAQDAALFVIAVLAGTALCAFLGWS